MSKVRWIIIPLGPLNLTRGGGPRDSVINPTPRRYTQRLPRQGYRHCFRLFLNLCVLAVAYSTTMKAKATSNGASAAALTDDDAAVKRIAKLEAKLTADPSDPNPLLPVIQLARHASPQVVHKAVWALHRMFILLIGQRRVAELEASRAEEIDPVKAWAKDRLDEYIDILASLLRDEEEALRVSRLAGALAAQSLNRQASGLKLLFALLPAFSAAISGPSRKVVHMPLLRRILTATLDPEPSMRGAQVRDRSAASSSTHTSPWTIDSESQIDLESGILPDDVTQLLAEEYWAKYDDLRWAFFREAA